MKKVGLMIALAVLALACSESVGGMMQDAGSMLADAGDVIRDAGDMMQPDAGAQDTPVECNKSETTEVGYAYYWAEFPISTPGETEVTVCNHGDPDSVLSYSRRDQCNRWIAGWFDGTNTGVVYCGQRNPDGTRTGEPKSITVHN